MISEEQIYYHFLSSRDAIQDLERKMIKVSTPKTFNDPFELMPYLRYSTGKKIKRYKDFRKIFFDDYGLLCFSKTWKEPLLWSHYADRHKGIAIGFQISGYKILHVKYRRDPKRRQIELTNNSKTNEESFRELAKIKYIKWEYEAESRVLLKLKDCTKIDGDYFAQFGSNLQVKEIRLGDEFEYDENSAEYIFKISTDAGADIPISCRLQREGYQIVKDGRRSNIFEKIKNDRG